MKKYKLTDETIKLYGRTLYRIQATKDFITKSGENIYCGRIGGFVESEANLSHEGGCWIFRCAKVFENAKVHGEAEVFNSAEVHGNAEVFGSANVFGNAVVCQNAKVFGEAKVSGMALVTCDAEVNGNEMVADDVIIR